jgi:hypothetical protein
MRSVSLEIDISETASIMGAGKNLGSSSTRSGTSLLNIERGLFSPDHFSIVKLGFRADENRFTRSVSSLTICIRLV